MARASLRRMTYRRRPLARTDCQHVDIVSFPPLLMSRRSWYPALAALLLGVSTRADAQIIAPAAAHRATPATRAVLATRLVAPPQAGQPSRRAWVVAGTLATAAFGAFVGWAVADEEGDVSCLGGERRSALTGAAAGAVVGLPMMVGLMALDEADSTRRTPARDSVALAKREAATRRGWGIVRYKVRSALVATAGSAVVGASIGTVAGAMAHAERPKACRSVGRAIGDGSASYGGAMVGLTVPMALLFDWPH